MSWYRFLSISCHCEPPYTIQLPPIRSKISISKVECARWSFGANFAWDSIKRTTIRKTHPTLGSIVPLRKVTIDGTLLYFSSIFVHLENSKFCCIFKNDCCITYIFMEVLNFFKCSRWLVMNTHTRRFQRLSLIYV